jgi:ankyrin repeat protein
LHVACQYKQIATVQYILEHGACIDSKLASGYTAFHIACDKGYYDIVVELTNFAQNHKVDIFEMKQNDEWTGLHLASRNGYANIDKYLIDNSLVDDKAADGNGKISLHFACANSHYDIVKLLVEYQQKHPSNESSTYITEAAQKNGWNAFHFAVRFGHLQIVQYLLTKGKMNVNSVWDDDGVNVKNVWDGDGVWDDDGMTSLHLARKYGYIDIVQHLLQCDDIDCDELAQPDGFKPSHLACIHGHQKILEEFHKKDPSTIKTCSADSTSVIHYACIHGHCDIVKWLYPLLVSDTGPIKNAYGLTFLHDACINGHPNIAKYLIMT